MSKRKMTQYDIEFKKSSAKLAYESDRSVAQTAEDLGINPTTLYTWVKKYCPEENTKSSSINEPSLMEELKRLKKENIRLKLERDILKKAAAYFASESQ